MASWRPARSITTLLGELDELAPRRSKRSDGIIGDAAHSARTSDHNPDPAGVVHAVDITHDPGGGVDGHQLAEHLADLGRRGDPRVKYVIWNRRISNPAIKGGDWRTYSGSNPHTSHVHLSVTAAAGDSTAPWHLENDMQLTDKIVLDDQRVVDALNLTRGKDNQLKLGATITVERLLIWGGARDAQVLDAIKRQAATVSALAKAIELLAQGQALSAEQITAAARAGAEQALSEGVDVDVTVRAGGTV